MSQFAQWKTIGYAAAIFVTGGISGGALGVYETRISEAKSSLLVAPRQQEMALRIRARFQSRLGLTPDQMVKINPIVESAASDLRAIRVGTAQRSNKVFEDFYAKISPILTPDQRIKLAEMQKEHRDMMQDHWPEGRQHPGRPDQWPDHDGPGRGSPEPPASAL